MWAPVPVMSVNEETIFKPVFIDFYEWLACDRNGVPEVIPENGECYYSDALTSQKYSVQRFLIKMPPMPFDFESEKAN